jgi:chromosome segregation ATPase
MKIFGRFFLSFFFLLRVAEWMVDLKNRGTPEDKAPQFITTSFRKEMVEVANKVIGVAMVNNASRIALIGREEAMDFITRTDV